MYKQRGQTIIELLVAIGISAIMLPALATAVFASREGRAQDAERLQAAALLRETDEAVRSVREKGWAAFAVNGTYHPAINIAAWNLVAGSEVVGNFTRQVVISDVQRNAAGAIVPSGGTIDQSTKKVTTTVSWSQPMNGSLSTETYYQRYLGNAAWAQTTQAEFNAGTKTNTTATSTGDGQVELAGGGGGSHVQTAGSNNDASATTIAQALPANVNGESLIVASISWDTTSSTTVTCSDNQNNTYTTVVNINDTTNTQALAICYASNVPAAATTVTATFGAASTLRRITVSEYSGVAAVVPVDVSKTNIANGTTATDNITSTAATTTAANDLIYGAVVETSAGTATITGGTGFTQRNTNATDTTLAVQDRILGTAGSTSSTHTFSAALRYAAGMVAFKTKSSTANWASPSVGGTYDASGTQDALDVFTAGNYAYLCNGSVLTILNISNPTSPTLVGTYTASSTVRHVYVDGNYAYLSTASDTAELTIVNITNPASPTLASSVNLTDTNDGFATFVTGGYAYVGRALDTTTGTNEFYILNVTNPASPSVLGSVNLTGAVNNIKVSGNFAFLATTIDTQEMVVINVTNKSSPTLSTSYNAAGTSDANDLGILGTVLYVATVANASGAEVFALNITTPTSPALLGTYETGANVTGVSAVPNNLFLSVANQLTVLNNSNPSSLQLRSTLGFGSPANDVKAWGDYVYVATASNTQEMVIVAPTFASSGYATSGSFDSSTFDAGASAAFNYLTFTITEPASTNISFQLATNNDNATWNYVGPDGTASTFYTSAQTIRLNTVGRYLRYRAAFTGPGTSTPVLSDISINYSP
ncbi:MAG TPA: prepilin-type N-terminal cleavage/methylation domain-containing protein [Candidatus Saccharimonadales bacterium]|nr:prepilin-type N-terminal cleavage/methylation domain-containing protein [Candidatus Saccharimonadales bacterium]